MNETKNWVIVCAIVIISCLFFQNILLKRALTEKRESAVDNEQLIMINTAGAPFLGNPDSPITIVEFTDFRCPHCAGGSKTLQELSSLYPNLKRVFKYVPKDKVGMDLARASFIAFHQNLLDLIHSDLYDQQLQTKADIDSLLTQHNIDVRVSDGIWYQQVSESLRQAKRLNIETLPTYFINGTRVETSDPEVLKRVIEAEVKAITFANETNTFE